MKRLPITIRNPRFEAWCIVTSLSGLRLSKPVRHPYCMHFWPVQEHVPAFSGDGYFQIGRHPNHNK